MPIYFDMETPIIDPSTLTEEQREKIREIFKKANSLGQSNNGNHLSFLAAGQISVLAGIFGVEFFKKGENNE